MMTKYDELMSNPEFRKEMAIESLVAEAAEAIAVLMEEQNLSKADVARRLGKSRAWVTQLLNGKANMTIRTLAEVTFVLGGEMTIQPAQKQSATARREPWRPIAGKMSGFSPSLDGGRYRASVKDKTFVQTDAEDYAA
jgi:transcriptional regulator with XRE-family HTH domain